MVERSTTRGILAHAIMILGALVVAFPIYLAFVASSHNPQELMQSPMPLLPGSHLWASYSAALNGGGQNNAGMPVARMIWVSFVITMIITVGKISISLLSAFAVVYFRFPLRQMCFWAIFITLMLPVEVRIGPTYQVVADLGMINTYAGLSIPLIASATATFLFRQFFLTVPDELVEAARVDGAGPMRTSTGSISVIKIAQKHNWRSGNRKYTTANADSSEMLILPTVMIIVMTKLTQIMRATGMAALFCPPPLSAAL